MLVVRELEKSFANHPPLFSDIDFELQERQNLIIRGANGSGKTTLLNCLAGLLEPDRGEMILDHQTISPDIPSSRLSIGFATCQHHSFFPQLTVRQNLDFFARFYRRPSLEASTLSDLGLDRWLESPYQKCSSGIQKRVLIARALINRPKLLLLDEPFSHIDPDSQSKIETFLVHWTKQRGVVLILSTNRSTQIKGQSLCLQ